MIINFNSDGDFSLYKMLEHRNMIRIIRSTFHESNNYYPQVFPEKYLYKRQIELYTNINKDKCKNALLR